MIQPGDILRPYYSMMRGFRFTIIIITSDVTGAIQCWGAPYDIFTRKKFTNSLPFGTLRIISCWIRIINGIIRAKSVLVESLWVLLIPFKTIHRLESSNSLDSSNGLLSCRILYSRLIVPHRKINIWCRICSNVRLVNQCSKGVVVKGIGYISVGIHQVIEPSLARHSHNNSLSKCH